MVFLQIFRAYGAERSEFASSISGMQTWRTPKASPLPGAGELIYFKLNLNDIQLLHLTHQPLFDEVGDSTCGMPVVGKNLFG
jgi:hypothetical protein